MAIASLAAVLILAAAPNAVTTVPPPIPRVPQVEVVPDAPLPPRSTYAAPNYAAQADAAETYPIEAPVGSQLDAVRSYAPSLLLVYPAPRYDCYSHGHHRLECYPSFCERHYRRPYNYRVEFDYLWHADVYGVNPDGYALGGECVAVADDQARANVIPFGRQARTKSRIIDLDARANLAAGEANRPSQASDAPATARKQSPRATMR